MGRRVVGSWSWKPSDPILFSLMSVLFSYSFQHPLLQSCSPRVGLRQAEPLCQPRWPEIHKIYLHPLLFILGGTYGCVIFSIIVSIILRAKYVKHFMRKLRFTILKMSKGSNLPYAWFLSLVLGIKNNTKNASKSCGFSAWSSLLPHSSQMTWPSPPPDHTLLPS